MKSKKDQVWEKAKTIEGKDPAQYRQDPYGNTIRYDSYGQGGAMSWDMDHIKPAAKGGSNDIRNLQALQSKTNREKGDSLVKKSRHSDSNK